jgi:hypothetical protein
MTSRSVSYFNHLVVFTPVYGQTGPVPGCGFARDGSGSRYSLRASGTGPIPPSDSADRRDLIFTTGPVMRLTAKNN